MIPLQFSSRIASCLVAFVLSTALTPLVRSLCIRFAVFDPPGPLKIHRRPIPRLGGTAIALAIVGGCSLQKSLPLDSFALFLGSLALVWIAGLVDDLRGLPPIVRLAAQAASALLLWSDGWHVPFFANSLWNAIATCLTVIVLINAFNFLDGSDGLAAGVAATVALMFAITFSQNAAASPFTLIAAWSLFGATAGFLLYNFAPASVFMGDSGSTLLGFTIAFLALSPPHSPSPRLKVFVFILFAAALPLLDAGLAFFRRLRTQTSPLIGDRMHFYDLLLRRGWSPRKVALTSYTVTALLSAFGWIALHLPEPYAAVLAATVFAALFLVALQLGSLRGEEKSGSQPHSDEKRQATASPPAISNAAVEAEIYK
jgi:UDP-GlcNAc:undecaprenyl-phosphate/decaprenyl-phosphate GlcNAc-1-phosphate transferase